MKNKILHKTKFIIVFMIGLTCIHFFESIDSWYRFLFLPGEIIIIYPAYTFWKVFFDPDLK
jgi:hypothetical protein